MSFSGQKSVSASQQTSTSAPDPDYKARLLQNYDTFKNTTPGYQPYTGDLVAGFTPAQTQAFSQFSDIANNQTGAGAVNSGIAATNHALNYTPTLINPTSAQAGQIDRSSIPIINANPISNIDLSKYMNPYTSSVVDATRAAAQNTLNQQFASNASDATRAGAWRGNALAVQNGITAGQSNTGLNTIIAQLQQGGYDRALGAATTDTANQLTADTHNQDAQLSAAGTNAGNTTQTNLANLTAQLQAAQSNQGAQHDAATLGLAGGAQLASMGAQQLSEAITRATSLGTVGAQQQAQLQAQLDSAYQNNYVNAQQYRVLMQQLQNSTLGLAGNAPLTQSQGTSTGKATGWSAGFQLGGGGSVGGSTGASAAG